MRKPHRKISTRRFNSINPHTPECITNFEPTGAIKIKSSANIVSQYVLNYGVYKLTFATLADDNVTVTMECGAHTMWQHTVSRDDAVEIYKYYKERW